MRFYTKTVITFVVLLSALASMQAQERRRVYQEQENMYVEKTSIVSPRWAIKTNLLYDAAATMNLGVEFRTGRNSSFDIPLSYNPFQFSNNRKWKHFLAQPEFRYWTNEAFKGHFFGAHAHYAYYNIGALPMPPFTEYMNKHRFEGWLAGAGLSYGYRLNISSRWAMEATVGVGYAYLSYDKFKCGECEKTLSEHQKNYFGVTKAGISLIYGFGGSTVSDRVERPRTSPAGMPQQPDIIYYPTLTACFVTPPVEIPKIRNEEGSVYLDFVVNRTEILPSFRNNARELNKLHSQLQEVLRDPYSRITAINIVGYASIEGTYISNLHLSQRRVVSLKEHVKSIHSLPESIFTVRGEGEDWERLDSLVAASNMTEKYNILAIIRGTGIFDGREKKLMDLAGGNPYRQIAADFFPYLRRADYTLHYTVLPFTVEQGKEVFRTKPYNLSLNEMFLIAQTYQPRSADYSELFITAARLFPDSDIANLNAAASAVENKDILLASIYLERVKEKNDAYWNNLGILQYLQGDKELALESFQKSGESGRKNAEEVRKHIQSVQTRL